MPADALTCLDVDDIAGILAKIAADIVVVVDLSQEADTLRVASSRIDQMFAFGYLAHLFLTVVADGEERLAQLPVVDLGEEVGLVFYRVRTGGEPFLPVNPFRLGVVACGYQVVFVTCFLVEGTELDEPVAHHVGVGREARLHLLHGVARHLVPVFFVAVDHL